MDVGLELRQARERRGISLQQLSQSSKISLRILHALERGDADAFPAAVYTRGFVRAYATEVGLPVDDTVRRYMAQLEPPPLEAVVVPAAQERRDSSALRISVRLDDLDRARQIIRQRPIAVASSVAVLALVAFAARGIHRASPPAAAPIVAAGLAPVASAEPVPVATSGVAARRGLEIEIAPTAACWVRATVDGQQKFAVLMSAGERRSLSVPSQVDLRVGDAAACAMTINGTPAKVGAPGQPVTVHLTADNYTQFLKK